MSHERLRALSDLHVALRSALGEVGITVNDATAGHRNRLYVPHLTLFYDVCRIELRLPEPIEWTVSEFVLINSLVGQSRYDVLGRWALSC
jgi:2'-5' RNA ligase